MKSMKPLLKNKKTRFFVIIVAVVILCAVQYIYNRNTAYYMPDYPMEDISHIVKKDNITDADLKKIFINTGVSPLASEEIIKNGNEKLLKTLNKLYFKEPKYEKSYIAFPVTANELNKGELTPLVPLKKGDVLITFNTHTFLWRHGHSAIVVDDNGEKILEHSSIGHKSRIVPSKRWGIYPSFMILRHKNEDISHKAAEYAINNLSGIDYSIFAGLYDKDKSNDKKVDASHCSHIVWQAYKAAGFDIDSDKGKIVTPYDIAMCGDFDLVQIFGINPLNYTK